ncbi:fumarylacetoacetate hydrolase family protein [Amycolatopsis rubida]|uniref:2-keto-4-pentenoate hydratase/2-oxohepta-3-ene-1,7-dioic acid hydratase (Catechol pathway) n=1 Tax=Amycolatopsis rubida TaxID=112413 RepID=A0A1I5KIY2_9PSEU|nr:MULTISPECIES: fumarylacetoacetate hydrolase family protein [Amycolatopsis]MYW90404.1 fumarylacetoacetate hydrolase [Amycolatopsis rubida]NEC55381.1 fumarylacetoacetate hydrolase family protein [Amycolatopsis rubida]OAP21860.1 Ureidoglycolate lyase [Amycolatopsis sp. M39]SFO84978.1 2-keto-4-pentenoate hydratase/2-oxohepta-3-ene-1,7-dioic acid hydratase (catechol pathway) [Amycolatopsis rubida]
MRISRIDGRYRLVSGDTAADIAEASGGAFAPDGFDVYERWAELAAWAPSVPASAYRPFDPARLDAPVALPRQVFAIGLNYRDHAAEANLAEPEEPLVFTKFPTCVTGPVAAIDLPSDHVDWEVELVVVIGARAHRVAAADAWAHVAGLTVGQDLSERVVQLAGPAPQFGFGKSFPGFGPIGPAVVTPDELGDPANLAIECALGDEVLQKGTTADLIFPVPELIARLSAVCPLLPGDLVFTGTPAGVGGSRKPPRFLPRGATLVSRIEGIGELRNALR